MGDTEYYNYRNFPYGRQIEYAHSRLLESWGRGRGALEGIRETHRTSEYYSTKDLRSGGHVGPHYATKRQSDVTGQNFQKIEAIDECSVDYLHTEKDFSNLVIRIVISNSDIFSTK